MNILHSEMEAEKGADEQNQWQTGQNHKQIVTKNQASFAQFFFLQK